MNLSPIVLFTYNRIEHLQTLLNSLKKNIFFESSKVIVFSDGPRNNLDEAKIRKVRLYLKKNLNSKKSEFIERPSNFGLSKNIINGLDQIFKIYDKAIVLEDDLELSPFFLNYMNDALNLYCEEEKIASISGYMYPINSNKFSNNYFFLQLIESWGWATWRRAWNNFEPDAKSLKNKIDNSGLIKEFNFDQGISYYKMLEENIAGKNDSWAVRWYASIFLKNMLTLFPSNSFVKNIGLDNSGEHCSYTSVYNSSLSLKYETVQKMDMLENSLDRNILIKFFKIAKYKRWYENLFNKVTRILK